MPGPTGHFVQSIKGERREITRFVSFFPPSKLLKPRERTKGRTKPLEPSTDRPSRVKYDSTHSINAAMTQREGKKVWAFLRARTASKISR